MQVILDSTASDITVHSLTKLWPVETGLWFSAATIAEDFEMHYISNNGVLTSTAIGIEYKWFLNDSVIAGENSIVLIPVLSGDYSVEVFFSNGCPTISNPYSFNYQLGNETELLPISYSLYQNYPNPFNPITTLRYSIPENELVNITVYDLKGSIVKTLINSSQSIGYQSVKWNAINDRNEPVSAGLYIYVMQAGDFKQTKKMVLLK